MFIEWMEYENKTTGQQIKRIEFQRMNLLVGPSAAGKTQILRVLSEFLLVASYGQAITSECRFQIGFRMHEDPYAADGAEKSFIWEIETGDAYALQSGQDSLAHVIVRERLTSGEELVFSRQDEVIAIEGYDRIPAIAQDKSIFYVFQGNGPFASIVRDMKLVSSFYKQRDAFTPVPAKWVGDFVETFRDVKREAEKARTHLLAASALPVGLDIHLAKLHMPSSFTDFLMDVQDVFPEIEDVDLAASTVYSGNYVIRVRIDGRELEQQDISSGMLRTICIFALLHFRCRHTAIFFDELENSLGVNCLDSVVERIRLKAAEEGTQFLLTSHHPYIINQIPVADWLLIAQDKGIITSKKAVDVGISTTGREQFMDLLNYMMRQRR